MQAAIKAADKFDTMSPKKIAELGPLTELYLAYQRLSDDSAHPSARALEHHVQANADRSGWNCMWCIGEQGQNAATLRFAILAALAIGVGVTQMLGDMNGNAEFGKLSERLDTMPPVPIV